MVISQNHSIDNICNQLDKLEGDQLEDEIQEEHNSFQTDAFERGTNSSSMLSLTESLVAADSEPPVIQKLIPEGNICSH